MKKIIVFLLGGIMLAMSASAAEPEKAPRRGAPATSDSAGAHDQASSSGEDEMIRAPEGKKARVRYTFPSPAAKRM